MGEMKKRAFLVNAENMIAENPDWVGDLVMAIQRGVTTALEKTYNEKDALAWAFSWLVEMTPDVVARESTNRFMQPGLHILADHFSGAPIEKKLRAFLETDNDG